MKKISLILALLAILLSMSCDSDPGLGNNPDWQDVDSPFKGGTWESELIANGNGDKFIRRISFNQNTFTFEHINNYAVPQPINDIFTGSYKIQQYAPNGRNPPIEVITFTNSDPSFNGQVYYTFDYKINTMEIPPENSVWFYEKDGSASADNFILAGYFNKIN